MKTQLPGRAPHFPATAMLDDPGVSLSNLKKHPQKIEKESLTTVFEGVPNAPDEAAQEALDLWPFGKNI